jgi:ribose 5-phosphate isomerase B
MKQKLFIACDHGGVELKALLVQTFSDRVDWVDLGTNAAESVDYPDYAGKLADAVKADGTEGIAGVLICGSGIGISIAANRFTWIRAALCTSREMATLARQHNDANVLVLGARIIDNQTAENCLDAFLNTDFEGGRHSLRVAKLAPTQK